MPSLLRIICLGLCMTSAVSALALEDTPENRLQEAGHYLQAFPLETVADGMAQRIASTLPQAQRAAFLEAMRKTIDMAAINAAARAGMVKVFTADELKALADFYGSPAGRAATSKMQSYLSEVMPTMMKEVQAAAAKAQQETGEPK